MTAPHAVNLVALAGIGAPMAAAASFAAWKTRDALDIDRSGSGWATTADLRSLRVRQPTDGRLTLGTVNRRLVAAEPRASVLVFGPTQSGKTTGLAAPAVREWAGAVVATSVKTDLASLTKAAREARGRVWTFDPTSGGSARWSPLDGCGDWGRAWRMASWLVEAARPAAGQPGVEDANFWQTSAQMLLAPLLFAGAHQGGTMGDVVSTLFTRDFGAVTAVVAGSGCAPAAEAWNAATHKDRRTLSNIVANLETLLAAFADPTVAAATAGSDFTPAEVVAGGGTLHIIAPPHEQSRLRPIFCALVKTVVAYAYDHAPLDPPLLICLDEAANVAPVADLDQIASTGAGMGVQLVTVFQDLAQAESRYGDRARTVVNNHRALVALSGLKDLSTLRLLSELVGDHDTPRRSHTRGSDGRSSQATAPERRRLAPVDELRRMKRGEGLLLYGSAKPARLKLRKEGPQRR